MIVGFGVMFAQEGFSNRVRALHKRFEDVWQGKGSLNTGDLKERF